MLTIKIIQMYMYIWRTYQWQSKQSPASSTDWVARFLPNWNACATDGILTATSNTYNKNNMCITSNMAKQSASNDFKWQLQKQPGLEEDAFKACIGQKKRGATTHAWNNKQSWPCPSCSRQCWRRAETPVQGTAKLPQQMLHTTKHHLHFIHHGKAKRKQNDQEGSCTSRLVLDEKMQPRACMGEEIIPSQTNKRTLTKQSKRRRTLKGQ